MQIYWMRLFDQRKRNTLFIFLSAYGCSLFGQNSFSDSLQKQFEQYSSQALQEKIFVHTDKTFYLTGEILWFKVYVVDGSFHRPLDLSKVVYLEIISKDQKAVLQGKIGLQGGSGNGSFILPNSMSSGNYTLRAYTSWMINYSPDFYFEKVVTIVNALKKPDWQPKNDGGVDIQFFPEGGNLVYGIESKIAFRFADQRGQGINGQGLLVNQNNDTVATFKPLRFGMGSFRFLPKTGDQYKAIIQLENNQTTTRQLPTIYSKGYIMFLEDLDKDHLRITVHCTEISSSAFVYLFAHTRQLIDLVLAKTLNNGEAVFTIDKKNLKAGISHFTIFNSARQPVCERLYFTKPDDQLRIDLTSNQAEYASRKKVELSVLAHNGSGKPLMADMSMSVFLLDSLQTLEQNDIISYLWLGSDLKGSIESPGFYFKNSGPELDQALDNLMLVNGWRRFAWSEVLQNNKPAFKFLPEYEGPLIEGKLIDKNSGTAAKNITAYLSVPGTSFQLSSYTSDENGQLLFNVKPFYGSNEIVVQTNVPTDSAHRIEISNPFSDKFARRSKPPFEISEKWQDQLEARLTSTQVINAYQPADKQKFSFPDLADTIVFFGKEGKTYLLDDYTRFTSMEEVLREYVAEVSVKKLHGKFHFRVTNIPLKSAFTDDPLILLDGVPVFDADRIMGFDPLKTKKIDVVGRRYYLNGHVYPGIVSFSTYKGDLDGFQLDPACLILEYQGLQLERQFYSPIYETTQQAESRLPDFRNLLHWAPDIRSNEEGKEKISFYTSDLPGKYAVVIQGISANGLAGSAVLTFIVRK